MVPIADEASQVERFKYLLSHGVKEHLVKRCRRWPGVHVARHLVDGEELTGFWFDRSRECNAHLRGKKHGKYEFGREETVAISPLPCMEHLSPEEYRQWVKELVHEIDTRYEAEREQEGREVLGVHGVRGADPFDTAKPKKKRPRPQVHAATKQVRRAFYEAFALFVAAYREAAEKLRAGVKDVVFPEGCFPPAMPYVPFADAAPRPP